MKNNPSPSTSTTSEFRNRFDPKSLFMVTLLILLVTIIILWNPIENSNQQVSSATVATQALAREKPGSKYTPIPPEMIEYREQTNGIVLGSVIMVLIVVGGTLSVIQRKN